jgi:hypothetical protein
MSKHIDRVRRAIEFGHPDGGLANTEREPWKAPLPEHIEALQFKHFRKTRPEHVRSVEQMENDFNRKKDRRLSWRGSPRPPGARRRRDRPKLQPRA